MTTDTRQERRHLSIMFSDLSHSTRIAAGMEPETYADLLQLLRDHYAKIIPRHGGEIVRIDGDGVLAIFGYPEAREDAARRAVEAAIDLHAAVETIGRTLATSEMPIALHSAVHAGMVLVRQGDLLRGRFEILGDATNIAAHLCDVADPGQILASESALGADIAFYNAGPRQQLAVRGRSAPMAVNEIYDRAEYPNRFTAHLSRMLTPFIGRDAALATLHGALKDSMRRGAKVVIVSGAPGLGKSRLISLFIERNLAPDDHCFRAYCESYDGAQSLQPFRQIVTELEKSGTTSEPDIRALCTQLVREMASQEGALAPDSIAKMLGQLLDQLPGNQPVVLTIDDWQWADHASRQVLEILSSAVKRPVLIILAVRDGEIGAGMIEGELIALSPLSLAETEELIHQLLPVCDPQSVDSIQQRSGGNPLYIEELCHALDQGQGTILSADDNSWLDSLVQSRFIQLPGPLQSLVSIAAIIGYIVPVWLFEAITGIGASAPEMLELSERDFLFVGDFSDTIRFKHGLTRDAVYRTVPLNSRQQLHAKIADILHQRAEVDGGMIGVEALAYHNGAAGRWAVAADFAERAGDRALANAQLDIAQAQYRTAIDYVLRSGSGNNHKNHANQLARKFGQACVVDPSREQISVLIEACQRAEHSHDVEAVAWAEYWLGFVLYGLGEPKRAIHHLQIAQTAARSCGQDRLCITIRATLGQAYAAACEYPDALPLLDEAIAIKRQHRRPDSPAIVLSYTLACRGLVFADQGMVEKAYQDFDEAVEVLAGEEPEMAASVLTLRCAADIWYGRMQEARSLATMSRDIAKRARARYIYINCRSLIAYPHWCLNGDPNASEEIAAATTWLEKTGRQQFSSLNFGWLTRIMVETGRFQEARFYAARALQRARKGDRLGEAMAARALAEAAAKGFGRRSAAHYLRLADRSAQFRGAEHEHRHNHDCADRIAEMIVAISA